MVRPMSPTLREAVAADVPAICALANALILTDTSTWTETAEPLAEREAWFADRQRAGYPVLVAEQAGAVVGFASYGDFRNAAKWPGYRFTVEHSVHVAGDHAGEGIGRALMEALLGRAVAQGKHVMVAAIDSANARSIRFHQRLGFTEVGRLPETGYKFGTWLDLVLLQRQLG
jgi:L-amino acid N-acyltransferase